jgi:hypothetical protein
MHDRHRTGIPHLCQHQHPPYKYNRCICSTIITPIILHTLSHYCVHPFSVPPSPIILFHSLSAHPPHYFHQETVRALAKWNATVLMANRNLDKSRAVAPKGDVRHFHLDLASFASTRKLVDDLKSQGTTIDTVIFNAATTMDEKVTEDGVDMQLQGLSILIILLPLSRCCVAPPPFYR